MAFTINTIDRLQQYLSGVSERATHHAPNVNEVILALAGAIVLFKESGTPLEARTYQGAPANILYVWILGNRYAFCYDHQQQSVIIRRNNVRGPDVGSFSNTTTPAQILQIFASL